MPFELNICLSTTCLPFCLMHFASVAFSLCFLIQSFTEPQGHQLLSLSMICTLSNKVSSLTHSLTCSLTHYLTHSVSQSVFHSCIHSFIQSFPYLCKHCRICHSVCIAMRLAAWTIKNFLFIKNFLWNPILWGPHQWHAWCCCKANSPECSQSNRQVARCVCVCVRACMRVCVCVCVCVCARMCSHIQ